VHPNSGIDEDPSTSGLDDQAARPDFGGAT